MPKRIANFTSEQEKRFVTAHPQSAGYAESIRRLRVASEIWQGHATSIPSPLQTIETAENYLRIAYPKAPDEEVATMGSARLERQAALRGNVEKYVVVVGERALRAAEIDRPQLDIVRLGVRGKLDNLEVHILPGEAAVLPQTDNWPGIINALPDLIIATTSTKAGLAAVIEDGHTIITGKTAEKLQVASFEIGALALTGDAAVPMVDAAIAWQSTPA